MPDIIDMENLESEEEDVMLKKEQLLQKFGWTKECDFPSAYWLWTNTHINVRGVSLDMAWKMQKNLVI